MSDGPPAEHERERQREVAPGLVEVGVHDGVHDHAVEARPRRRRRAPRRPRRRAAPRASRNRPIVASASRNAVSGGQRLPGLEARQLADRRERVVDRLLRAPRHRHLVHRQRRVGGRAGARGAGTRRCPRRGARPSRRRSRSGSPSGRAGPARPAASSSGDVGHERRVRAAGRAGRPRRRTATTLVGDARREHDPERGRERHVGEAEHGQGERRTCRRRPAPPRAARSGAGPRAAAAA